ncbi:MAG: 16S rRNA (uracil(1498)-N(3))-methyltransferase [Puniceicoccales bacterium]|nr:16S rRNA (uracil(1498)-N(3))-methyltransferase [Puniceicoccales bacterium]
MALGVSTHYKSFASFFAVEIVLCGRDIVESRKWVLERSAISNTMWAMAHFSIYVSCEIVENQPIELDQETAHHLLRVLRIGQRDRINVFDGAGTVAPCTVEHNRKSAIAIPGKPKKVDAPRIKLHLLQGITKGQAMDSIVRMATELGVWEIHPIACTFAAGGLRADKSPPRVLRWNAIAIGACRQSHNPFVPSIGAPTQLENAVLNPNSLRLAAGLGGGAISWVEFLRLHGRCLSEIAADIYLAVGPEGDFSDDEWQFLRRNGFIEISLGPRVLTSETAAVALMGAVQLAIQT